MATKIITKTGSGAPTTSDVDRGELAVDLTNKQLYTNDGSSIIKLGSGSGEGQWSLAPDSDNIYYDSGAVGINRTPNSDYKLDVAGSVRFTTGANFNDDFSEIYIGGHVANTRQAKFRKGTGGTENRAMQYYAATLNSGEAHEFYSNLTDLVMKIDADGKVGIGTNDPATKVHIQDGDLFLTANSTSEGSGQGIFFQSTTSGWNTAGAHSAIEGKRGPSNSGYLAFSTRLSGVTSEKARIDGEGRVGIGGAPGTRTAADYIDQAKEKIKSWTAAIKTKLDEEPKADKKAVTLEVTDDAFEVIPTEDLVAEWMAERAIGGGDAKLQVAGDASIHGDLLASKPSASSDALAVGRLAGNIDQGGNAIALGLRAAVNQQGSNAVAVGAQAGQGDANDPAKGQGEYAVAVGFQAGQTGQGDNSVAIGSGAGAAGQGENTVALGRNAGLTDQGESSVALGRSSGYENQGANSIAIGRSAGETNQAANGIIISSTGSAENVGQTNHILLKSGDSKYLYYNGTDAWTFAGGDVSGGGLRFDSIVQDGAPVVDSLQIIRAFMKLRDAVDDPDSSVEELRDKLKVAVVDIIDQFQDLVDSVEPDRER
jgi:hypothetical protein